jgi:eukaryotic-like serine/threonine-protein kinase
MLTGADAFDGPTAGARIAQSLSPEAPNLKTRGASIPDPLRAVVEKALSKDPEQRYADAGELQRALASARAEVTRDGTERASLLRRPLVVATGAAAVALAALALWWADRATLVSRTYADVLPRIEALQSERDLVGAWRLARDARAALPDDERVLRMMEASSLSTVIELEPPGASFAIRSVRSPDEEWVEVGLAPIGEIRLPAEEFHWRAKASGRESVEGVHSPYVGPLSVELLTSDESAEGMVWIPEGELETADERVPIDGFWIDRLEVTNADYQRFVDEGGYRTHELAPFADTTGQPGPANWRLSRHGAGEERLPVSGISWFEARAYCENLGKSLPTFGHWRRAASLIDETLPFNNFNAESKAPVGSHAGLSQYGAYDMAGNVREWVVNASGDDRYVLGGAFNQPEYLFEAPDVLPPDARLDDVGVRCMKSESEVPDSLRGPLPALRHDFRDDVPIADDVYAAVTAQFSYDRVPFSAETLSRDDSDRRWIRETVSYPAPYGDERIVAHLYLPRNALPPYQTIVYFPGSAALSIRDSSTIVETSFFDFVPASGRVLVYPIYQRMYERRSDERLSGASAVRDLIVQWSKEVSRTVDYLETREDVDADRLAFVGLSLGAYYGPIFAAMEPRFEAIVFIAGGLSTGMEKTAAEIHPLNHAPHITAPTLMVSGRWDFLRDIELEQQPLYDAIGLEEPEKRFAILDGGHMPDWNGVIRETLDWLGLHLGPVRPARQ